MAPRSKRNMKTKEVKIPHLTVANRKKMETSGLGGLFAVDWSGTYDSLLEELAAKRKGDRRQSKSGVFLEQVEGNSDFVLFCHMLNAVFAPVRPEYFQHNLFAFYHHAWAAITNPAAPTLDWGDVVEKTVSKQIKALGTVSDSNSDTETETEDEKEPKEEIPRAFCKGEANRSKPLDQKIDYAEWGIHVESLGRETSKLFEVFHVEIGSVTPEAMARNMKEMFALPPVAEADI
ncbi:hypothetical protein R1flu_015591 [Riccia fluitans]|uniref:Uncharacterized protein n=1 Tax=Riccia fluitans TaxID=41844 RepID=A0ABD1YJQ3_9MARC